MKQKLRTCVVSTLLVISPLFGDFGGVSGAGGILSLFTIKTPPRAVLEQLDPSVVATIETLATCESGNRDDIVIVDTNGYRSYGRFQFQLATFRQFAEKYELVTKGLTNDELRPLLLDGELQEKVVYKMLTTDPDAIYHWKTCTRLHQLADKVVQPS